MPIHPTAIIDPEAMIDPSAEIGPYVVIEGPVRIGADTRVRSHVFLAGWTEIGQRCDIHPFAVIGHLPQDFHFEGGRSFCKIGDDVVIREHVTIHRGTQPESTTEVGDRCFLLTHAHVAHNCRLGRGVTMINGSAVAGHVTVDDGATIGVCTLVHQFVRIGRLAFLAGQGRIGMDVPPFMTAFGASTIVHHNLVGLRRAGFSAEELREIRQAFRTLYRSGLPFSKAVERLAETVKTGPGRELVAFLRSESRRGFCAPASRRPRRADDSETAPE